MTELFLHGTDIRTRFEQVGCERVPQPVTGYVLFDSRIKGSLFYRAVDFGFIDVMAPQLITIPVIFCNNRATSNRGSTTDRGSTVNVTVISGGTADNVIPDYARASVNVRITHEDEGRRIEDGDDDACDALLHRSHR